MDQGSHHDQVSDYYGRQLQSSNDLRTSACCPVDSVPKSHSSILSKLAPEVTSKFYGCGSPIPPHLQGMTVLDLGCGTGRDVYLTSALVGKSGKVIGVDMTEAQLQVARKYQSFHAKAFFGDESSSNVDLRRGYIEDLTSAGIEDDSIDVVISNCVCNLSPQKSKVFEEVFRVLKPGGELYFSDIYADRRLSSKAMNDPVLVGECLGGALYIEDFRRVMYKAGFHDVRVVSAAPVVLHDAELLKLVPDVSFYSITIRAFKISDLEDRREDYGQIATYNPLSRKMNGEGGDLQADDIDSKLKLDIDNVFEAGTATKVDANTATMIQSSRFHNLFSVTGRKEHSGLFRVNKGLKNISPALNSFRPVSGENCTTKASCMSASKCNGNLNEKSGSSCVATEQNKTCCAPGKKTTNACCP